MLESISKLDQEYLDSLDFDVSELSDDEIISAVRSPDLYADNYFTGLKIAEEYIKRGLYECN